eukprot:6384827-Amphidinium_carterae.1
MSLSMRCVEKAHRDDPRMEVTPQNGAGHLVLPRRNRGSNSFNANHQLSGMCSFEKSIHEGPG